MTPSSFRSIPTLRTGPWYGPIRTEVPGRQHLRSARRRQRLFHVFTAARLKAVLFCRRNNGSEFPAR